MQEGKPIAYAFKLLKPSEVNNAQVEKNMFAILLRCKRFHHFVFCQKTRVQTDHLLLVSIFKKTINSSPPPAHLQRMLSKFQRYDLEVKHYPSNHIPVEDNLSRNYMGDTFLIILKDLKVHLVLSFRPAFDRKKWKNKKKQTKVKHWNCWKKKQPAAFTNV